MAYKSAIKSTSQELAICRRSVNTEISKRQEWYETREARYELALSRYRRTTTGGNAKANDATTTTTLLLDRGGRRLTLSATHIPQRFILAEWDTYQEGDPPDKEISLSMEEGLEIAKAITNFFALPMEYDR